MNTGNQSLSHVDRYRAAVRRWQLEAELLGQYHLTPTPDIHLLDEERRADQARWQQEPLAEIRQESDRAKGVRLLRRVVTLGSRRNQDAGAVARTGIPIW